MPHLSLDSRPTLPQCLGQILIPHQVGDHTGLFHFHLRLSVLFCTHDPHNMHLCELLVAETCKCTLYPSGGGFQFGGASAFGATNNSTGVFTFGAGAASSPAPSANPSLTPQSGAAGGGFNFAQPPTFNIGYVVLPHLTCMPVNLHKRLLF